MINFLDSEPRDLWDHEEDVDKTQEAPPSKEEKGAPVVSCFKERRDAVLDGINKEPVEGLADSTAKGSEMVRPELTTKDIG